jgi:hypothetical protein
MAHMDIGLLVALATRAVGKGKPGSLARHLTRVRVLLVSAPLVALLALSLPARAQIAPEAPAEDITLRQCGEILSDGLGDAEGLLQASLTFCDTAMRPDDNEFLPAVELFRLAMQPIGYGASSMQRAAGLFLSCPSDYPNMPSAGEELLRHVDMVIGCANGAEVTIGVAWADHLRTSVIQELLTDGYPPLESAEVGDWLRECLVARVGSGDDLLSMRRACGNAVAVRLIAEQNDMRHAVIVTTACTTAGELLKPNELVVAAFQTGVNPEEACTCGCPASPRDTSPSAVALPPTPAPPAPVAPPATPLVPWDGTYTNGQNTYVLQAPGGR